jgi:N-acetyl-anhydromuramyl-L-alanine amidase AmpD
MADQRTSLFMSALLIAGIFTWTGCGEAPVVNQLPAANFNGPLSPAPVAPPVAPQVKVAQKPVAPEPRKPTPQLAGVPRDWIPNTTKQGGWNWIVIHHSATPSGGAKAFDRMHKEKGWDELGYHFVIGNGTDTGDGQIEVGPRWPKQKWGAHAKTPSNEFNNFGIGICLVGNFDTERPTRAQTQSLARLVAYLMKTYHVSADHVIGHGDTKATDCPGRNLHVAEIRRMATQLATGVDPGEATVKTASGELLIDAPGN